MSATRPAPVATVLASSAIATFPPAKRSAMIPEPTTVAKRNAVPIASDARRRVIEMSFISANAQQQPDFVVPALEALGPQQLAPMASLRTTTPVSAARVSRDG